MVNTEMGMIYVYHHGGSLVAYTAEKGWAETFVSIFWSQLVGVYHPVRYNVGINGIIVLKYWMSLIITEENIATTLAYLS